MTLPFPIEEYPIVIGIDFGTTYSGVSYAFGNDSEIVDITKWPRQPDYSYPKYLYKLNNDLYIDSYINQRKQYSSDDGSLIQWGRFTKSGKADQRNVIVIQQFKIYLDENPKRPLASLPMDLTITGIISDYLQKMFAYIKTYMSQKGFNRDFDKKARYCLTVK
ncbi:Heat shock 70 kDa protein 12A [Rhizopus stolonifer]|uniref:Heat shock 70 kDa protein 12A n=1 Tax=Rhizopus stolonifer TaxID=4846 RepID=A0A367KNF1_RHIST|nr:Heat shock 70 kDa protein 12A [Rhizopus stolonifer]